MSYKGYIFDLDDTLYCEHDYVRSGFQAVAEVLAKHTTQSINEIHQLLIEEWKRNGRGRVFDAVCGKLKINSDISTLVNVYRNHKPLIRLYQDAERMIHHLIDQKKKIAIITDGHPIIQWAKIDALFLQKWFQCIVVTGDLGEEHWKPSATPYRKIVDCLGLDISDCVYIGDNPHKDFITAKKLGMGTIRIVRPVGDHMQVKLTKEFEADRTLSSLEEII
ncbi:HAD family hydrolase [Metabacillus herbersteinensis]